MGGLAAYGIGSEHSPSSRTLASILSNIGTMSATNDDPPLQSPCVTPRFQLNPLGGEPTNEIELWAQQIAAAFQDTGSEATLNIGGTDGKQGSQECTDDSSLPLGVTGSSKPTSTEGNAATATQKRDATDASSSNDSSASGSNPRKKRKKRRIKKPGDRHYVCLLRSDSFTGPPMIKQWIGKDTPKQIPGQYEPRLKSMDPRDPTYAVSLKIGPMNKVQAKDFHKNWSKSTQSDKLIYERESVGRQLAIKQGFKCELLAAQQTMSLPAPPLPVISEGTKVG